MERVVDVAQDADVDAGDAGSGGTPIDIDEMTREALLNLLAGQAHHSPAANWRWRSRCAAVFLGLAGNGAVCTALTAFAALRVANAAQPQRALVALVQSQPGARVGPGAAERQPPNRALVLVSVGGPWCGCGCGRSFRAAVGVSAE